MADARERDDRKEGKDFPGPPITPFRAVHFEKTRPAAESAGWAPWSIRFWRCMAIAFCVFSIVGHWMEIPYCLFNDWAFGIVDDDSLVFDDPMYPFLVYGIAAVLGALFLVPQRDWLSTRYPFWQALLRFFLLCVGAACAGELIMGFLLNQPDPITGEFPLWDNSQLPLNIFGQAWLINDILLGTVITLYIWVLYPALVTVVNKVPERWGWPVTIAVVVSFIILCIVKFTA